MILAHWYKDSFSEMVKLPGSSDQNGKGDEVTLKTDRTGILLIN